MKHLLLLLIPFVLIAAPVKYGNSTHYKSIQLKAANIYEADTNVPIVLSGSGLEDVIAGAALESGFDIVVTNSAGVNLGRTLPSFNKLNDTLQLCLSDPATHATNGGTPLFLQWGGDSVANDVTIWQDCHGSTDDYFVIAHTEAVNANVIDETGNYTATDASLSYSQSGPILKGVGLSAAESGISWGDVTQFNNVSKYTVSTWLRQTTIDVESIIYKKRPDFTNRIQLSTFSDGNMYITDETVLNSSASFDYSTVITAGQWHHVTVSRNGDVVGNENRLKVFVDGVQVSLSFSGSIPPETFGLEGASFDFGIVTALNGGLDEIRLFSGSLTLNQNKTQYDIQNGFATNATITIGTTTSFSTLKRKVYQNDAYKTGAYLHGSYR